MDNASVRTLLYGFGRDQFRAACLAVLGGSVTPELRYGGLVENQPSNDKYWARVTRRIVREQQETLRNGISQRRFMSNGFVVMQLFGPVADSKALNNLDNIAELLRNAFRTHQATELEFTNAEINDNVAPEPNWITSRVTAEFNYRQFIS